MAWYWQAALWAYGMSFVYGFGFGVCHTDELMGPSPELMPTLWTWFGLGICGPLVVFGHMVYFLCRALYVKIQSLQLDTNK
jgi:hypothetical protein